MECDGGRFRWRLLWLAALSAALAIGSAYLQKHRLIPAFLVWPVALLPVLPMAGYFVGLARSLQALDELQRLIQLEALLIQFGLTGLFVFSYGLLANAGAVSNLPISESWVWIWMALFLSWAVGQFVVRRKYR
jgi:hypothetical protein